MQQIDGVNIPLYSLIDEILIAVPRHSCVLWNEMWCQRGFMMRVGVKHMYSVRGGGVSAGFGVSVSAE